MVCWLWNILQWIIGFLSGEVWSYVRACNLRWEGESELRRLSRRSVSWIYLRFWRTCWRTFGRNEISIWFWGWKKVQSTLFLHKSNESQATSLVYTIRPHLSRSGTLPAHELKLRHHQAILRVNFLYFVCSVQNSKRREVPEFEKFPKFPFRHSRKELSVVSSGGRA